MNYNVKGFTGDELDHEENNRDAVATKQVTLA